MRCFLVCMGFLLSACSGVAGERPQDDGKPDSSVTGGATGGGAGSTGSGGATGAAGNMGNGGSVGSGGASSGVGGGGAAGGSTAGSAGSGGTAGRAGSSGSAGSAGATVDAGSKGGAGGTGPVCDAGNPVATPVPDASARCTSGKKWTSGNGPTMSPGDICQGCHAFTIAGTVYPTIHETGLCNGINGGAQVVVTPACGTPITLDVNGVGNFYYMGAVRQPFTAKVVVGGVERAMLSPQTLGDCNACHTQNGLQGAPGRIIVP